MDKAKVKAYFDRIGVEMPATITADAALLRKLQYAHCVTVPYENLDIFRGVPLSLKTEDLYRKVVENHRGGYCFELNGLFAWLLRELGYQVEEFGSRYLRGEAAIPFRRHRTLGVTDCAGKRWLVDVGIGDKAPREPILMEEALVQEQCGETYRLDKDDFLGWVLSDLHHGKWRQFYSFTEEQQLPVDYEPASFWCEKHPDSPFIPQEMFSLKTADGRITLDGHLYRVVRDGHIVESRELTDAEMPWAYEQFGLKM